jgi:hypothetical protein
MKSVPKPGVRKNSWDKIDTLEANLTQTEVREIRSLLAALNDEYSLSKSFASSPVKFLLGDILDRLVLASNIISQGSDFFGRRNPSVRFIEEVKSGKIDRRISYNNMAIGPNEWYSDVIPVRDPLGNPVQVTYRESDIFVQDTEFADWLMDTAWEIGRKLEGFEGSSKRELPDKSTTLSPKTPKKLSKAVYYFHKRRRSR